MTVHITVPDEDSRTQFTVTGASTGPFVFNFSYFDAADLIVLDGSTEILPADYTLTPVVTALGGYDGGSIVLDVAVSSTTITVYRDTPAARTTDFPTSGLFNITTLNTQLDKLFAIQQQAVRDLARTLRYPAADAATSVDALPVAATRASKFLFFDVDGNPTTMAGTTETPTTAFAATLLDDADAATARATLGVYSTTQVDALIVSGTQTITAGENLANRNLIYQDIFNQRSGGATLWYQVDTNATGPVRISPYLGVALAAITATTTGLAQTGVGVVTGFAGLTAGQRVWASTTAGGVTQTVPAIPSSGTQVAVRPVGVAASATSLLFEPSADTVFVGRNSALTVGSSITVEHYTDAGARERVPMALLVSGSGVQTAIAQALGTAGGNLVNGGNVAAAFDGVTVKTAALSALLNTGGRTTGRIGKVWPSSHTINGIVLVAPSDTGFNQVGGSTITFNLYGGASTVGVGGVSLGSGTVTDSNGVTFTKLSGFTTATAYICHWVDFTSSSGSTATDNKATAQCTFYETPSVYDEPIDMGNETIDSASLIKVNCKFTDASNVNPDTFTTFINRTNATRDLAVEVLL